MRKALAVVLAAALLLVGTPGRVEAHSIPSDCPALTDSITRLFKAYFDRDPDPAEFDRWVDRWRTGELSLEEISAALERSPEFRDRHLVDNLSFVTWVFSDLLAPDVSAVRSTQWVEALNAGLARGTMLLSVTESEAFVVRSGTARPLAGYLRWYPKGTRWYCGRGSATVPVGALTDPTWADYFVENLGPTTDPIRLRTLEDEGADSRDEILMDQWTLDGGASVYNPDGAFSGDGHYGRYLEVVAGPSTDWIVVFYPRSLGSVRSGWSLAP